MYAELHPDAQTELTEHALFYEYYQSGLGFRFINEIERGIKLLLIQPRIGHTIDSKLRSLILHEFPYSLIYRIEQDKIWILAVAHQRRRPGYWRMRTE